MNGRLDRISEEVKKTVGEIIQKELKDPRLPELVSVLNASVTKDLKYAKIYISVLGDETVKKQAMAALSSASGFIRREMGKRVKLRLTPEIIFELDDSIEHGIYISKLIDENVTRSNG